MKTMTLKSGKEISLNQAFNMDCLDFMKELPDKCIDLVLTDPPYGIADKVVTGGETKKKIKLKTELNKWDKEIPSKEYFIEMFRISKNQIIWGGNYFIDNLTHSRGWIVWDKMQPEGIRLSKAELAFTSFNVNMEIFRQFTANANRGEKIHPTQKPLKLFQWCLSRYAEKNMIIFDPFLGSFTTAIASHKTDCNWLGCEKDPDYFKSGYHRYEQETKQLLMEF